MSDLKEKRIDEIQGEILHVYDGIEEADNELPLWWLWTLYGAIIFSVVYWFYYHEYNVGELPPAEWERVMAERAAAAPSMTEEEIMTAAGDDARIANGRTVFETNCVACHEAQGQGNIGPNLTDGYWIHGGASTDIYETIDQGVLTAGMPAWGTPLGRDSVLDVTAYVLSIRDTNVEGKEPQGELYAPDGAAPPSEEGGEAEPAEGEDTAEPAAEGEGDAEPAAEGEGEAAEPAAEGDEPAAEEATAEEAPAEAAEAADTEEAAEG